MNTKYDTESIRRNIIHAQQMRETYDLIFKNLCIKHDMVCKIEDTKDATKKKELIDNYEKSIYYSI